MTDIYIDCPGRVMPHLIRDGELHCGGIDWSVPGGRAWDRWRKIDPEKLSMAHRIAYDHDLEQLAELASE